MRKLIASLPIVVFALSVLSSNAVGGSVVPDLTAWDLARAEIVGAAEIDATASNAVTNGGISPQVAIAAAGKWVDFATGTRVYSGRAAQFPGEAARDVIVVVVAGGNFPYSGPAGETVADRQARITGVIFDAKTGEFMSGFMLT